MKQPQALCVRFSNMLPSEWLVRFAGQLTRDLQALTARNPLEVNVAIASKKSAKGPLVQVEVSGPALTRPALAEGSDVESTMRHAFVLAAIALGAASEALTPLLIN